MCGRYGFGNPARLGALPLGVELPPLAPRFNIAPSELVPVVGQRRSGERRAALARWGLVPHWAEDPSIGHRLVNARGDSVRDKPSFRSAFRTGRALMPADLFYEWQAVQGSRTKQPWCIRAGDDAPFAFGALVERWKPAGAGQDADWLLTCTVITTEPNEVLSEVHDRMPLIVPEHSFEQWLDPATPLDYAERLIAPYAGPLRAWRVGTYVNSPENDDERCITPLSAE